MKRLWTEPEYKKAQARRRRKAERRNREHGKHHGNRASPPRENITITAPTVFSLVQSPDDTLKFLQDLRKILPSPNLKLEINLKQIKKIEPEAIAAFVAVMNTFNKGRVSGNVPDDPECTRRLHDFGFFECVTNGPSRGTPGGKIRRLHRGQEVNGTSARDIIEFGLQKLGNSASKKHGPSYTIFTEAMANTFQHANAGNESKQNWWAGVYYDEDKQAACFTCVDLGVGILKSFSFQQTLKSLPTLLRTYGLGYGDVLKKLLSGDMPSRTREKHRGRGLPNIKSTCRAGRIQNLVILSNKAHAHVGHEIYESLGTEFRGTILYWEVSREIS